MSEQAAGGVGTHGQAMATIGAIRRPELGMDLIERLTPTHAEPYRALMLEAYAQHPDAFTSSRAERAALPLSWWEARLGEGPTPPEMVFGAFIGGRLSGVA